MTTPNPQVVVDADVCFSFGRCIDTAPDVFSWSDDGLAVAGPVAGTDAEATARAVESCPRMAINFVTSETSVSADPA
jgi:ferredoxin